MSTSRAAWLTSPSGDDKISEGTFGYINARVRQRAYNLIVREFKKQGLTQATLARRWGKAPEVVSRFLARPANWELDTFCEALFAISGAVPKFEAAYPAASIEAAKPQATPETDSDFDFRSMLRKSGPVVESNLPAPANNNFAPMPQVGAL